MSSRGCLPQTLPYCVLDLARASGTVNRPDGEMVKLRSDSLFTVFYQDLGFVTFQSCQIQRSHLIVELEHLASGHEEDVDRELKGEVTVCSN